VLAVPESAIVRHEGRVFVFVVEGNDKFVPRDVAIGPTIDSWVEIHSGLTEGDRIAVAGTFVLKSELLLEAVE
jgi:Cu(I)/Ag(I) efflux system membrane fusion protein